MRAYIGNATHEIDLEKLVATRLLIQSNSGGGKSWAIRRILEQTAGAIQQIVIDPEGEFATLREKHDMIICAPRGADAEATPKTASLLARKLLETGVSAVVDIYELKAHERQDFVRRFIESLVNAPKKLWHPVMIVLDEAHVFAPEKGKSISTGAVIDLATRGRKRGFCLIVATQRLAKLQKDVAAELLNKMIGRTGLDVDIKRAADELGMSVKDAWANLRDLDPGGFYIYGPALARSVEEIKVGKVLTTHGHNQNVLTEPPAPSAKIKKLLDDALKDLAAQADEEARSIGDYKRQLQTAVQKIKMLERSNGTPEHEIQVRIREAERVARADGVNSVQPENPAHSRLISKIKVGLNKLAEDVNNFDDTPAKVKPISTYSAPITPIEKAPASVAETGDVSLRAGVVRILQELAVRYPAGYTKSQLAVLSKFKASGGTFGTYLGDLRRAGFLREEGSGRGRTYYTTEEGMAYLGTDIPDAPTTHQEVMEQWERKLRAGCFKMLKVIVEAGSAGIHRQEIADIVEMTSTGGTFGTYLGDIRRNELAHEDMNKIWVANDILFPERI